MELLGEEIDTEVAVLARLRGSGDADDLARAALKDQEIANADVVAGDSNSVRGSHAARRCVADCGSCRGRGRDTSRGRDSRKRGCGSGSVLLDYDFLTVVVV
jgi:hypothetical protein